MPVYAIIEINVTNMDGFMKEYSPKAGPLVTKAGGKRLAAGDKVTTFEGAPATRVIVQLWDNLEQFKAYRDSAETKELRKIGNKYATFRTYTVEALQ